MGLRGSVRCVRWCLVRDELVDGSVLRVGSLELDRDRARAAVPPPVFFLYLGRTMEVP